VVIRLLSTMLFLAGRSVQGRVLPEILAGDLKDNLSRFFIVSPTKKGSLAQLFVSGQFRVLDSGGQRKQR
jgi:hypothetical protein